MQGTQLELKVGLKLCFFRLFWLFDDQWQVGDWRVPFISLLSRWNLFPGEAESYC